jgi:hypothetical protein
VILPEQPLTVILPPALMLQTPSRSMMVIGTRQMPQNILDLARCRKATGLFSG